MQGGNRRNCPVTANPEPEPAPSDSDGALLASEATRALLAASRSPAQARQRASPQSILMAVTGSTFKARRAGR